MYRCLLDSIVDRSVTAENKLTQLHVSRPTISYCTEITFGFHTLTANDIIVSALKFNLKINKVLILCFKKT